MTDHCALCEDGRRGNSPYCAKHYQAARYERCSGLIQARMAERRVERAIEVGACAGFPESRPCGKLEVACVEKRLCRTCYQRWYRTQNRERSRALNRANYARNGEKYKASKRADYERRRDVHLARDRASYQKHRDARLAAAASRRAARKLDRVARATARRSPASLGAEHERMDRETLGAALARVVRLRAQAVIAEERRAADEEAARAARAKRLLSEDEDRVRAMERAGDDDFEARVTGPEAAREAAFAARELSRRQGKRRAGTCAFAGCESGAGRVGLCAMHELRWRSECARRNPYANPRFRPGLPDDDRARYSAQMGASILELMIRESVEERRHAGPGRPRKIEHEWAEASA